MDIEEVMGGDMDIPDMDMLDIAVASWAINGGITSSQGANFKKFCRDNNLFENYASVYGYWEKKEYDMAIVMGGL